MASKHIVKLPSELMARCRAYGEMVIDNFRRGRNTASRAVSSHGAEENLELQVRGRAGECAFCLWSDAPVEMLNWSPHPDIGFDIDYLGIKVDVKTFPRHDRLLCWPVGKNHLFDKKNFDALVMVKAADDLAWFKIVGYLSKAEFAARCRTAPAGCLLTPGTRYVYQEELHDIDDHYAAFALAQIRRRIRLLTAAE